MDGPITHKALDRRWNQRRGGGAAHTVAAVPRCCVGVWLQTPGCLSSAVLPWAVVPWALICLRQLRASSAGFSGSALPFGLR